MNKRAYTNNGKEWKRVSKAQARKLYYAGETVILCAVNMKPFGMLLDVSCPVNKNKRKEWQENDFDKIVNSYEYYTCNNELGKYSAFYA